MSVISFRERWFPVIWGGLAPLRWYLRAFPFPRGKGILLRHVLTPLLPPAPAEYPLELPGKATVSLRYRETLGLSSLLYGTFERAELEFVHRYLQLGQCAFDIGANVGLFATVMGRAVGSSGLVLAVEPAPSNVERLAAHVAVNAVPQVRLCPFALGAEPGRMSLKLARDAAYHSLMAVEEGLGADEDMVVEVRRLDDLWKESGSPEVALVKMDVEGAEPDVLKGAVDFLAHCTPVLLIEANSRERLAVLEQILGRQGYVCKQPDGFVVHNYLFYPAVVEPVVDAAL